MLSEEHHDVLNALDQAVADEAAYFTDTRKKNPPSLELKT